ncbi:MAG: glycosyltransferase family 4 protein [Chloroflexi bacterium]|nr:glycosyltransferase family 4 protein [Chloroflexota bacterium]
MADPHLVYIVNSRLPTEKAYGLQIAQMCEAFAGAGYRVTLLAPWRFNTAAMHAAGDLWSYYGVTRNFRFRRLPALDLFPIIPERVPRVAFLAQTVSFLLALLIWLALRRAQVYYTRDLFVAALLGAIHRRPLVYEVHQMHRSRWGQRVQRFAARRAALVVTITAHLGGEIRTLGVPPARVLVAHDGIRRERFAAVPDRQQARAEIGWPQDAFVVGWVGRLHLMGVDKGVGLLVEALQAVEGAALAIVGGPDDQVAALRERWIAAGLDASRFLAAGQVRPDRVPRYLGTFDVCAMPHPWTEHFAYHTSPIKLFEYMASGRPIVASNLPGFAEVLRDGENGLLVPPGDAAALAAAIQQLRDDPALRERLVAQARADVLEHYTWAARAGQIRASIEGRD